VSQRRTWKEVPWGEGERADMSECLLFRYCRDIKQSRRSRSKESDPREDAGDKARSSNDDSSTSHPSKRRKISHDLAAPTVEVEAATSVRDEDERMQVEEEKPDAEAEAEGVQVAHDEETMGANEGGEEGERPRGASDSAPVNMLQLTSVHSLSSRATRAASPSSTRRRARKTP
jgi:hypothetical protein